MTDFVFLHGGGQGSWIWDETLAAMALQSGGAAKCLALDVPGCGTKRGRDTAGMSFQAIIDELAADMDAAGVSDVMLVGHSQAGTVLPGLIAARPKLIAKAVYVSCIAHSPGHATDDMIGTMLAQDPESPVARAFADPDLEQKERFRVMFCNDMSKHEQDAFLAKLEQDAWPESSYTEREWSYDHLGATPATYVHCLQDQILPPKWQRIFADRLRCIRTVHIDAAHQVQNTRPHALAEVLLAESRG